LQILKHIRVSQILFMPGWEQYAGGILNCLQHRLGSVANQRAWTNPACWSTQHRTLLRVDAGLPAVRARSRMVQTMQFFWKVETNAGVEMQAEQQAAPTPMDGADPVVVEDYDE
jgi:hypothetical protein